MAGHTVGSCLILVFYIRQGRQFSLILLSFVPSLSPPPVPHTHLYTKIANAWGLYLMPFNIWGFTLLKFTFHFPLPEYNCSIFVVEGRTVWSTILIWCILHTKWTNQYFLAQLLSWQGELATSYLSTDHSGDRGSRLSALQSFLSYVVFITLRRS